MVRIENLLVLAVTARVRGDHLAAQNDVDAVDVGLDRHGLERRRARHAVAVVVEARHLILVDLGRLRDARIEALVGQGKRLGDLACEALADGLGLARLPALAVAQAAFTQVTIEFVEVAHPGHRRCPVALQMPHAAFDARLLLRPPHHAEERLERVVAHQRLIALVEPAFAAGEQVRRDRLGIVPPQFARHDAIEMERLVQAMQDRFGALARQRDREGTIRVAPSRDQDRHEPAALGEVDMNVAEVGFEPLTRIVIEWDECLALRARLRRDVSPDATIAAAVALLVTQAAKNLGGRVSLLGRRLLIGLQDVVDNRLERIDDRRHDAPRVRLGFGQGENLADLAARVMKLPRQLANAQLVDPMGLANTCIFVHRDHPPPPVVCHYQSSW
jgi:hypothetical protein